MRFAHLASKLYFSPLHLAEPAFHSLHTAFQAHLNGGSLAQSATPHGHYSQRIGQPGRVSEVTMEEWRSYRATNEAIRVESVYQVIGRLAIVTMAGVIDRHLSTFEMECYGGCDLNDIDAALRTADADPAIETIILAVNSPGGSAVGTPETAELFFDIGTRKQTISFTDYQSCSAAIYIASQAGHSVCSQSAIVGSIGTYMALLDQTRWMEIQGFAVNLIKEGKFKAMGAPWKKLEEEERALLQSQCKQLNDAFRATVSRGRERAGAKVPAESMEGQAFFGQAAIDAGLCDELVASLDDLCTSLLEI